MLDARSGVECDVAWGGSSHDPANAPGPSFFEKMFPGTFIPLTKFLKVRGRCILRSYFSGNFPAAKEFFRKVVRGVLC